MEYCIVYLSSATRLLSEEELSEILHKSRHNNRASGITGILLYFNGNIIQVLEGDEKKVDSLYKIISQDPRHTNLIQLYKSPIERRSFPDWLMGYKTLSALELDHLNGLIPFAGSPLMPVADSSTIVLKLVKVFYEHNYQN